MKFQTEQINYLARLKKKFLFGFLIYAAIILYVHFKNSSTIEVTGLMIGIAGFGLALVAHLIAKKYFYEVELIDGKVILRGDSMNKLITVKLPIPETNIFVKSKGKGRGNVEYFVRFKHISGTFDINKLFNWNYETLLELFHAFKETKNEKIIWDEKYLLEFMEKKSRGMSSFEIAFGKDKKDDPITKDKNT